LTPALLVCSQIQIPHSTHTSSLEFHTPSKARRSRCAAPRTQHKHVISSRWHALPRPNSWWISCGAEGGHEVHYDLLTGKLLIDGKPLGRLPQEIVEHPTYASIPSSLSRKRDCLTCLSYGELVPRQYYYDSGSQSGPFVALLSIFRFVSRVFSCSSMAWHGLPPFRRD
jgi:hypothetical protein